MPSREVLLYGKVRADPLESKVLKNRVEDAAAALYYQINHLARSVQLGSSRTVGMLVPAFATPDPFYAQPYTTWSDNRIIR